MKFCNKDQNGIKLQTSKGNESSKMEKVNGEEKWGGNGFMLPSS